jgi:fatty-acid peroxygenase
VLWAVRSTNIFRDSFTDRMQFNPGRFAAPPANPFAFVPQGGGPPTGHRCAGFDYSTLLLEIFTIVLIRDYTSRLTNPDVIYNWKLNPPQPVDGLLTTISPN